MTVGPEEEASRLRAGALGAIDGITSTAGVVIGVAAAGSTRSMLLIAGLSTLVGGALSMGAGEYASVATGRDAEIVDGVPDSELANPWAASVASGVAFTIGGIVPVLAVLLASPGGRVVVAAVSVLVALVAAGIVSARLGNVSVRKAVARTVIGGGIAMAATWTVGVLAG